MRNRGSGVVYRFSRLQGPAPSAAIPRESHPARGMVYIEHRYDLANHSPDGFEWGYEGSGPAQAALAVLADFFGGRDDEAALRLYQKFKRQVIAVHAEDSWRLTGAEILRWLEANP